VKYTIEIEVEQALRTINAHILPELTRTLMALHDVAREYAIKLATERKRNL
jgi:hypothetical protein